MLSFSAITLLILGVLILPIRIYGSDDTDEEEEAFVRLVLGKMTKQEKDHPLYLGGESLGNIIKRLSYLENQLDSMMARNADGVRSDMDAVKREVQTARGERNNLKGIADQLQGKVTNNTMQLVTFRNKTELKLDAEDLDIRGIKDDVDNVKLATLKLRESVNATSLVVNSLSQEVQSQAASIHQLFHKQNETSNELRIFVSRLDNGKTQPQSRKQDVGSMRLSDMEECVGDYNGTEPYDCGGVLVKDSGRVEFKAPYPLAFNYICLWTIRAGNYENLNVSLVEENFAQSSSKLKILPMNGLLFNDYNGSSSSLGQIEWAARSQGRSQQFEGNIVFIEAHISGGSSIPVHLLLTFTGAGNSTYFSPFTVADYYYTWLNGSIENFNHGHNERFSYIVAPKTSSPYRNITLSINLVNLEMGYDFLKVYGIGSQSLLGTKDSYYRFSWFTNATMFGTHTDNVGWIIAFRSDHTFTKQGYSLEYRAL